MDVHPLLLALRNEALTAPHALLTIAEATMALHVNRPSTDRFCEAGKLRWVRICGTRRISSAEFDRFIADHTNAASQSTRV